MSSQSPRSRLAPAPVLWGAATVAIAAGYGVLSQGSITAAPLLLVLGYAVFAPIAIIRGGRAP